MNIEDYKNGVASKLLARSMSAEDAVRGTAEWYTTLGRDLFIAAFEHETSLKLTTTLQDGTLVEWGFPKNLADYGTKAAWGNFYRANAMMFLRETDAILQPTQAGTLNPGHSPVVFWENLRRILEPLFLDSYVLLEYWASGAMEVPGVFGIGKNVWEEPLHLYHSALQCIYGNYSPIARQDNQADTAINHLRVAIELRIRRGFGIMAKLDQNKAVAPLMLSRILDALSLFKQQVVFAVPLEHIIRIYEWANLYMHAGLKLYTWSPMFALRYLSNFFAGGATHNGKGWSVYAGISASEQIIKDIQATAEAEVAKNGETLILMDPSKCHAVITP
jgi:hypothetical protein